METIGNRCRILIVDDHEPMRALLAHYVTEELQAEIDLAGSCEDALHLADQNTYDLILLDLLMPGIGGFEALRRIRADSVNKSTPVIVVSILVTSLAGEGEMAHDLAVELGVATFVAKPISRGELLAAIRERRREWRSLEQRCTNILPCSMKAANQAMAAKACLSC
jgi:DNA-binding response OmpR family regulator